MVRFELGSAIFVFFAYVYAVKYNKSFLIISGFNILGYLFFFVLMVVGYIKIMNNAEQMVAGMDTQTDAIKGYMEQLNYLKTQNLVKGSGMLIGLIMSIFSFMFYKKKAFKFITVFLLLVLLFYFFKVGRAIMIAFF